MQQQMENDRHDVHMKTCNKKDKKRAENAREKNRT